MQDVHFHSVFEQHSQHSHSGGNLHRKILCHFISHYLQANFDCRSPQGNVLVFHIKFNVNAEYTYFVWLGLLTISFAQKILL